MALPMAQHGTADEKKHPPSDHHLMAVTPAEKDLLLLIRDTRYGEMMVVIRDSLPTYAEWIKKRVKLGQRREGK